jgi:hypothetical protein
MRHKLGAAGLPVTIVDPLLETAAGIKHHHPLVGPDRDEAEASRHYFKVKSQQLCMTDAMSCSRLPKHALFWQVLIVAHIVAALYLRRGKKQKAVLKD